MSKNDAVDRIFNAADSCSPDDLRGPIREELERRDAAWARLVEATNAASYMNTQDSRSSYEESAAACGALRDAVKDVESFGVDLKALGVDLAHLMGEDGR